MVVVLAEPGASVPSDADQAAVFFAEIKGRRTRVERPRVPRAPARPRAVGARGRRDPPRARRRDRPRAPVGTLGHDRAVAPEARARDGARVGRGARVRPRRVPVPVLVRRRRRRRRRSRSVLDRGPCASISAAALARRGVGGSARVARRRPRLVREVDGAVRGAGGDPRRGTLRPRAPRGPLQDRPAEISRRPPSRRDAALRASGAPPPVSGSSPNNGGTHGVTNERANTLARRDVHVRAVIAVRYLRKELAAALPALLPASAAVCWFHFARGAEKTAVGRPNRARDLLEPGELRGWFGEARGFRALADGVAWLPDGRPVSEFVAVKDPSGGAL